MKSIRWGALLALALTSPCAGLAQELKVLDRQTIMIDAEEELHFPFLHQAGDGAWYLTYRRGKHAVAGGDRVNYATSTDRGKTWSPWRGLPLDQPELQPQIKGGDSRVRMFRFKQSDGLLLSHRYLMEQGKPAVEGQGHDWEGYVFASQDDGAHWELIKANIRGMPFTKSAGFWGHFVSNGEGTLLAGVYGSSLSEAKFFNGIVASDDGGRNWRYLATIAKDIGTEGPNELDLVWLPNGHLLSVFRTGGGGGQSRGSPLYSAVSSDEGKTWSEPRELPKTEASVSPQLLRSGDAVLLVHGQARRRILAKLTRDGMSWTDPLMIHDGAGSGYADLQLLSPGRVQVVYEESTFSYVPAGTVEVRPETNRLIRAELELDDPKSNP